MARLTRLLATVSLAASVAAAACLAVLVIGMNVEVAMRYFFRMPVALVSSIAPGLLCASILLALPEVTQRGRHIAMTLIIERSSPRVAATIARVLLAVGAVLCLAVGWITAMETARSFGQGIMTIGTYPLPKWLILSVIPFSFTLMAVQFALQAIGPDPRVTSDGMV